MRADDKKKKQKRETAPTYPASRRMIGAAVRTANHCSFGMRESHPIKKASFLRPVSNSEKKAGRSCTRFGAENEFRANSSKEVGVSSKGSKRTTEQQFRAQGKQQFGVFKATSSLWRR